MAGERTGKAKRGEERRGETKRGDGRGDTERRKVERGERWRVLKKRGEEGTFQGQRDNNNNKNGDTNKMVINVLYRCRNRLLIQVFNLKC